MTAPASPPSSAEGDGPDLVFLVGAPRSGTTWLQRLLAQSPSVSTANETHLFNFYLRSTVESWDRLAGSSRRIGLGPLIDEDGFVALCRRFADPVFERILANKAGADLVLEKTPDHSIVWRAIRQVYPRARFIHLVRDPRAVAASLMAAGRSWGADWAPHDAAAAARLWARYVDAAGEIEGAAVARYESLREDPAATLRDLLAFIGRPASPEDCAEWVRLVREDRGWAGWDEASEPEGFVRGKSAGGWRDELSDREVSVVEIIAGDRLARHSYAPVGRARTAARLAILRGRLLQGAGRRLIRASGA